jgi:spore coat protein U-like protein
VLHNLGLFFEPVCQEWVMTLRKILAGCTLLAGFAVAGLVGGSGTAWATDPTTGSLDISATVEAECAITATAPAAVGTYDANSGTDATQTGTITYQCSSGMTGVSITLDKGTTSGGSISQRLMTDTSSDTLMYNIYQGAGETTLWGDGTTGTAATGLTTDGATHDVTYYVDVPSGQYVAAGSYSDTVTATIVF